MNPSLEFQITGKNELSLRWDLWWEWIENAFLIEQRVKEILSVDWDTNTSPEVYIPLDDPNLIKLFFRTNEARDRVIAILSEEVSIAHAA